MTAYFYSAAKQILYGWAEKRCLVIFLALAQETGQDSKLRHKNVFPYIRETHQLNLMLVL